MIKKFAKRVVAIAAITTMLCAMCISASAAATYNSTTTYYNGLDKIQVNTSVSGLTANDEVTYLAYEVAAGAASTAFDPETSTIVYVNQYTASGTTATFSYVTDTTNVGSSIKMAKADSTFANGEKITAGEGEKGTIAAATVDFKVKIDGIDKETYKVECVKGLQTITIPVAIGAGKTVSALTIGTTTYKAGDVIVTPTGITVDFDVEAVSYDVAITTTAVDDNAIAPPTAVAYSIDYKYSEDINGETVSGTAYAIIADATNTPVDGYEIGVVFSDNEITRDNISNLTLLPSVGGARGTDNKYAIAVVDDTNPTDGTVYYATYMKATSNNEITLGSTGSITLTQPTTGE